MATSLIQTKFYAGTESAELWRVTRQFGVKDNYLPVGQILYLLIPYMDLTFPKRQILDSSKLTEFSDGNSRFDENGRKFSKRVENTVGKGEIARYEQFSFSHSVFKRLALKTRKNKGLFEKGITNKKS